MKKLIQTLMELKTTAAFAFAGFMCAYVVLGALYAAIFYPAFEFNVPFIFVLEGVGLAVVTALLWRLLFDDRASVKTRYFPRLVIFAVGLAAALAVCLLIFYRWHTNEAKLWLIAVGLVAVGFCLLSVVGEIYYRVTGKKYTELLKIYQRGLEQ